MPGHQRQCRVGDEQRASPDTMTRDCVCGRTCPVWRPQPRRRLHGISAHCWRDAQPPRKILYADVWRGAQRVSRGGARTVRHRRVRRRINRKLLPRGRPHEISPAAASNARPERRARPRWLEPPRARAASLCRPPIFDACATAALYPMEGSERVPWRGCARARACEPPRMPYKALARSCATANLSTTLTRPSPRSPTRTRPHTHRVLTHSLGSAVSSTARCSTCMRAIALELTSGIVRLR